MMFRSVRELAIRSFLASLGRGQGEGDKKPSVISRTLRTLPATIPLAWLTTVAIVLIGGAIYSAHADESTMTDQRELIAILESDAPSSEKAITCKHLAIYGTESAVPALEPLLADQQLASWSRIALEAIPGSAADEALRAQLPKLQGRLLIGVIHSIGVRRDAQAVAGLARQLHSAEADVAAAAAYSLGRIGNIEARDALVMALADASEPLRSAIAEGGILAAEKLLADGDFPQAAELYDKIRHAHVSRQRILEATRGMILTRAPEGPEMLVATLRSSDHDLFGIGLRAASEMSGAEVTRALIAEMRQASADRQSLLLLAISQRDDDQVVPVLLQAAVDHGATNVRRVALESLQRVGDSSCVSSLLEIATGNETSLHDAAKRALEHLGDSGVDRNLVDRLQEADGPLRLVLIELVGRRRIAEVPILLEAIESPHKEVRAAALTALGATVGPDDLSVLVDHVAKAQGAAESEVTRKALLAAAIRMPDRDACAIQLQKAMGQVGPAGRLVYLETIANVGGAMALQAMAEAAASEDADLQDAASRLLGTWMTADAAPVLLALAASAKNERYQRRALRGYVRIVRQFSFSKVERAVMCQAALQHAKRVDDKVLILEVLDRYPSRKGLEVAVAAAQSPQLKDQALATAHSIAKKIDVSPMNIDRFLNRASDDRVGKGLPANEPSGVTSNHPLLYRDDFSDGSSQWQPTDSNAWRVIEQDGDKVYSLRRQSKYEPPFRSPHNIALLRGRAVGSFDLTVRVVSTTRDYGHRSMCLFFGYQDPAHFYYVHLGQETDDHANQIFIVNGEARTKISSMTTSGTPWDNQWHDVRILRDAETGLIEIYWDDMAKPVMTAQDKTFLSGRVGLGSFDDTGNWDDFQLYGQRQDSYEK